MGLGFRRDANRKSSAILRLGRGSGSSPCSATLRETPMPPETHLKTRPLHKSLACEVEGPRLWEPLDPDTVAALRELWSRWGVLVFRRQALSELELAQFCALLGPLERTVRTDWASPSVPEVTVLSNLKDGLGHPIGGARHGELGW